MLRKALEYPLRGSIVDYLIGGTLWFVGSVLMAPLIFLWAYLVETCRKTVDEDDNPPSFDEITLGAAFKDGFAHLLITIVFSVISIVIVLSGVVVFTVVDLPISTTVFLLSLGLLVSLVNYVIPAAITAYAHQSLLRAAFSPSILAPVVLSRSYLLAWVLVFTISVSFTIMLFGSLIVPFVGVFLFFLIPAFVFYLMVFAYYLFARAYRNVIVRGTDETMPLEKDESTMNTTPSESELCDEALDADT